MARKVHVVKLVCNGNDTDFCKIFGFFPVARYCNALCMAYPDRMDTYVIPTWTLGDRLQKARKTAGLGSTEMGDRLGLTRTTIANYESGRHRVPHAVLRLWSLETGVPLSWLLDTDTDAESDTGVTPRKRVFDIPGQLTPESQHQRRSILRHMVATMGDTPLDRIGTAEVVTWWASIDYLAPASRQAHLSTARQFFAYLHAIGMTDGDPTSFIRRPKVHRKPPVTLTLRQVLTFLASLTSPRDRAIAALMLGCGLRGCDVASLNVADVDLDGRVLRVTGKGQKVRLVPMPMATVEAVATMLDASPHDGALIPGRNGGHMSVGWIRQTMSDHLVDCGIKTAAWDGRSSHVLRRTCATMLLESGATIRDVATVLGHEHISTTEAYLALPETRQLVAVVERGPLAAMAAGREKPSAHAAGGSAGAEGDWRR